MPSRKEKAIEFLKWDIWRHETYLNKAADHLGKPGYNLQYLKFLADDIHNKRAIINTLNAPKPARFLIDDQIKMLREYQDRHRALIGNKKIPTQLQDDAHHIKVIDGYESVSRELESKK